MMGSRLHVQALVSGSPDAGSSHRQPATPRTPEQQAIALLRELGSSSSGHSAGNAGHVAPRVRVLQALARFEREQGRPLHLASPEVIDVTREERNLLRALAAAQHVDDMVMDNYLSRVAPRSAARAALAEAVRLLAADLLRSGVLLATPASPRRPLPAAALTVACFHGLQAAGPLVVSWPGGT